MPVCFYNLVGSRTEVVKESDFLNLIKFVLHTFLMGHLDLGKERKRSTSFLFWSTTDVFTIDNSIHCPWLMAEVERK